MKNPITRFKKCQPRVVYVVHNIEEQAEEASWEQEPFNVLQRKIEFLMQELGCSEREANRMVFGLLG